VLYRRSRLFTVWNEHALSQYVAVGDGVSWTV
jgi:hypothetical protein